MPELEAVVQAGSAPISWPMTARISGSEVPCSRLSLSAMRAVPPRPETFALMRLVCFEALNQ